MFKKLFVGLLIVCILMTTVMTVTAFADENENTATIDSGDSTEPTSGYMLYIYNADGSIGYTINGTKSISEFNLASALEDAYVFGDNAFLFGLEAPLSYEIVFYQDIVINEQVVIPEDKTVTIDLNGHVANSASSSATNHIYALSNKGTLTITDSSAEQTGAINSRGIYNYGSLTLNGGAINSIDGNGGYAVNNQSGSTFVMNGGVVAATYEDDYQSSSGGYDATALKVPAGCTATLNGGKIVDVCDFTFAVDASGTLNIPADSTIEIIGTHGAIAVSGGKTTIDAGAFSIPSDEYSRTDNVIYVSGGELVINGGTFIGDSDTASGGSCVWDEAGAATINGGIFGGSSGGDVWGTTGTTIKGGKFENLTEKSYIAPGYELGADGTVSAPSYAAEVNGAKYETLEEAFAAALEGETITLLADATPALKSQRAITKAAVIDLGGCTLTLTEDDLYFGTTTFKNGTIVVDPSVKASTAVFWMFSNQTLTFDGVKLVATGVTGTYLIGLDGNNSDLNLIGGSEILVENTEALDLDIICVNASTGNDIVVEDSKVNVTNLDGRVFFRGNYTIGGDTEIYLDGITKAGFRIEAGQTLTIEDNAKVEIVGEPRDGGIHLTDVTATYKKADTVVVNATVNRPTVAEMNGEKYASLADALAAAKDAGLTDVIITLLGNTSASNAQFFDLVYATEFNSVTFKQADASQAYYINELYTGSRVGGGDFIFDGVNIVVTGQYMFEGNVKLINNSEITSTAEANCFFYYATVTIEAGSKIKGVIDDFRGGDVIVDGGRTDGQYNTEAGFEDAIMHIRWSGDSLIIKNGGYVKVNQVNEIGRLEIAAGTYVDVQDSKLEAKEWINVIGELRLDTESLVSTAKITGSGKIIIDAEALQAKKTLINADFSSFTGTIEIINNDLAAYSIVGKTLLVQPGLSGSGTESDPYLISSVDDLILFRDSVNAGETKYSAPGVWVVLNADIDMAGINWVGIGSAYIDHGFMGNFDGNGYKFMNLTIIDPAIDSDGYVYAGLFSVTEGDKGAENVIKNIIIENVTISTSGHIVSAAIAYPYYTTVENVTVRGDINITGGDYTAGVLAYTRRCVNASNLTVAGNSGSTITGNMTVGGVISDIQMNGGLKANYSNFKASGVTVKGVRNVGGISGIICKQSLNGAEVKNVTIVCEEVCVGIVSGAWGDVSTITNVVYENVSGATSIIGGNYKTGAAVEASVGDTYYATLAEAVAAAQDGDTITLLSDVIFNEETRAYNSGSWYDGLYYIGDKSFTIDLGGFTIGQDGSVNDYLLNFKNDGSKANVITLKNGTIDAGTAAFCAICTSSTSTQQITINLENINVINNISNGSTIKLRGGAVLNVNAGTKITGKNSYLGIECVASTVNINDGAEIYMNGTSSYNGCLVGVCGGGVVNVYGGYGVGVKGGFIAMTSGGTINIYGGEWIANTDGSIGNNSNVYVLTSQNNKYESGYVGASIINVYGGTFRGGMDAWILNQNLGEVAELNIFGGNFNAHPNGYVAANYAATKNADGTYDVVEAVAKIGNTYYASLADAFAAANDGDTIVLLSDIALEAGINNNKVITLDLNGKTITGTDNATGSFGLITNKGTLTITGNGKITLVATIDRDWNAYSSVISNTVGGKLIVENGTIEHLGGTDMAYGIDNLTNGKGTYAETVINGGIVKSTYRAIRMFLNGIQAENILTVNGGVIEGANKSIWMQDPSKNANTGKLTVGEGAVLNGDIYLTVTAGSTEWPVQVAIAASAVNGKVLTSNVPANLGVSNVNGVYTIVDYKADAENNTQIGGDITDDYINVDEAEKELLDKFPGITEEEIKDATIELEVTVEEIKASNTDAPSEYSYNVAPMFGVGDKKVKIEELAQAVTFRLPINSAETRQYAEVYHNGVLMGVYEIKEENGEKFVEIASEDFSTFTVVPTVHVAEVNGNKYFTIEDAIAALKSGDKLVLANDIEVNGILWIQTEGVTLDLNGHVLKTEYLILTGSNNIVDNGKTKGLLQIPRGRISIGNVNYPMLPVWNEAETGYVFVQVRPQAYEVEGATTENSFKIDFRPSISGGGINNKDVFCDGAADNDISMTVVIKFVKDGVVANNTLNINVTEDIIKSAYTSGRYIRLNIVGADNRYDSYIVEIVVNTPVGGSYREAVYTFTPAVNEAA